MSKLRNFCLKFWSDARENETTLCSGRKQDSSFTLDVYQRRNGESFRVLEIKGFTIYDRECVMQLYDHTGVLIHEIVTER